MNIIRDKRGKFRSIKDLRPFEVGKEFIVSMWEMTVTVVLAFMVGILFAHVINLMLGMIGGK